MLNFAAKERVYIARNRTLTAEYVRWRPQNEFPSVQRDLLPSTLIHRGGKVNFVDLRKRFMMPRLEWAGSVWRQLRAKS